MAWRSSGTSNASLVENLWRNKLITQPLVKQAFLRVDRAHYAPGSPYEDSPQTIGHRATISAPHMHASAVESLLPFLLPVPTAAAADASGAAATGAGKSSSSSTRGSTTSGSTGDNNNNNNNHTSSSTTTSSSSAAAAVPSTTTPAFEVPATTRDPTHNNASGPPPVVGKPGRPRRVLDIGSGSGYLTHVMAELVNGNGNGNGNNGSLVVGLEHIRPLQELGRANMGKSAEGRRMLEDGRVRFRLGDGRKGWVEPPGAGAGATSKAGIAREEEEEEGDEEGWDAIHVGAAAVELHDDLVAQLRRPGRMFIPVSEGYDQFIWTVDKDEKGEVRRQKLYGVRYVPLTDAYM